MAPKVTIQERCPRCQALAARRLGEWIYDGHDCAHQPPGPPSAPRMLHVDAVHFERATWSAAELLAQRDAAFDEIAELRDRCGKYKRRLDDVFVAMKYYETSRIA